MINHKFLTTSILMLSSDIRGYLQKISVLFSETRKIRPPALSPALYLLKTLFIRILPVPCAESWELCAARASDRWFEQREAERKLYAVTAESLQQKCRKTAPKPTPRPSEPRMFKDRNQSPEWLVDTWKSAFDLVFESLYFYKIWMRRWLSHPKIAFNVASGLNS